MLFSGGAKLPFRVLIRSNHLQNQTIKINSTLFIHFVSHSIPQMDWYYDISLIVTNYRKTHVILGRGKTPLPSPNSKKTKMPSTICRKCGTDLWNYYNYCPQHMPEHLKRFYFEIKHKKEFSIVA